jgi:hypothetical protein
MLLNPVPSSIYFHSSQGFRTPMSLLALLLSSLLFFSGFAAAGIYAPDCSLSWEWVCICRFPYAFFGCYRCLIRWHCVQTFNTLGQNACTVAAFMMSTCSGGCESLYCLTSVSHLISSLSQRSLSMRFPARATRTRGQAVLTTPICASATPSHIPSLVHVTHAKERNGFRTIPITVLSINPWAYVSDLSWAEYKYNCTTVLVPSESVFCCCRESIALDLIIGPAGSLTLSLPEQVSPSGLS